MHSLASSLQQTKERLEEFFDSFVKETNPSSDTSTVILISPWTVKRLGEILGVNVAQEGNQVPNLKTFLRVFPLQFRVEQGIKPEEIESSLDMILQERIKQREGSRGSNTKGSETLQTSCVECGVEGERYCVDCNEASCLDCCGRLHAKGNRAKHTLNKIIPCSLCRRSCARLLCTYTFRSFCIDCYRRRHLKTIPHEMLDLRPLEIDYTLRKTTPHVPSLTDEIIETAGEPASPIAPGFKRVLAPGEPEPLIEPSTVGKDWHPFLDSSGVIYYYNFVTQESMRRASTGIQEPVTREQKDAILKVATFISQTV